MVLHVEVVLSHASRSLSCQPQNRYHKVKQSSNAEGCVVAINYWYVTARVFTADVFDHIRYDMEFLNHDFWSLGPRATTHFHD